MPDFAGVGNCLHWQRLAKQGNRAMQKKGEYRTIDKTTACAAKAWSRLCKP